MSKLDDFENTNISERVDIPSGKYQVTFEKVARQSKTKNGYDMYSLQFGVTDGEYKGNKFFVNFMSGWKTKDGKDGSSISALRTLLKVIFANNLEDKTLQTFYKKVMNFDAEKIEDFFELILETNKLNGNTCGIVNVVRTEGNDYVASDGTTKKGHPTYNITLDNNVEKDATEKINSAFPLNYFKE